MAASRGRAVGAASGAGPRGSQRAVGGSQPRQGGQGIPAATFTSVKHFHNWHFTFVMLIYICNRFARSPPLSITGVFPPPLNSSPPRVVGRKSASRKGLSTRARQPCPAAPASAPRLPLPALTGKPPPAGGRGRAVAGRAYPRGKAPSAAAGSAGHPTRTHPPQVCLLVQCRQPIGRQRPTNDEKKILRKTCNLKNNYYFCPVG